MTAQRKIAALAGCYFSGFYPSISKATSQSPHITFTSLVARMIAPHFGQTYLMLRFLLALRPPLMVVADFPSSSPLVLIWSVVCRLVAMSLNSGWRATHSAVYETSSVTVHP